MKTYKTKEIDAIAMSAFCEEEKGLLKALCNSEIIESKPENYFFDSDSELNGGVANQGKKEPTGFFSGIQGWIKENPTTSMVIGAAIGGLAYLLYKHISDKKDSSDSIRKKARSKRKKRHLACLESHKEESRYIEKAEPISREELGISIAAALGGSVVGAALGQHSLIAAIPLGIAGIFNHNLSLSMASIGMALVGGNKKDSEENSSGVTSMIRQSINRIEDYLNSWTNKFYPFNANRDKVVPPGAIRTMLGYMYPTKGLLSS